MSDIDTTVYWTTEFAVTAADLDRLAAFIDSVGQAQHLSTLAKRVVNGRLRYGREQSTPVSQLFGAATPVKLWDPAGEWQVGDQVIVLRRPAGRLVAHIGEVQAVDLDGSRVEVFIPEEKLVNPYGLLPAHHPTRQQVVANVERVIARKREQRITQDTDESRAELVEIIMLEHGERVAGLLLHALREDERFLFLDGRFYLHALATPPDEAGLKQLAWSLLLDEMPQPTNDLLARLPQTADDATLFGLYLGLRQHPEWFRNTQPGQRPLWALAGPPPAPYTPQHAAYDPDSYEILCLPGEEAGETAVQRLWEAGLLTAIV